MQLARGGSGGGGGGGAAGGARPSALRPARRGGGGGPGGGGFSVGRPSISAGGTLVALFCLIQIWVRRVLRQRVCGLALCAVRCARWRTHNARKAHGARACRALQLAPRGAAGAARSLPLVR
jgi:hypothetical protein